jgi:hypothetical protein
VSVWCGLDPLKGVQGQESIAQCHGQVRTGLSHDIVQQTPNLGHLSTDLSHTTQTHEMYL